MALLLAPLPCLYLVVDMVANGSLNLVQAFQAFQTFKQLCKEWPNYNAEVSFLNPSSSKNLDLPEDLFVAKAGEVRPSKPAKKVAKSIKLKLKG